MTSSSSSGTSSPSDCTWSQIHGATRAAGFRRSSHMSFTSPAVIGEPSPNAASGLMRNDQLWVSGLGVQLAAAAGWTSPSQSVWTSGG